MKRLAAFLLALSLFLPAVLFADNEEMQYRCVRLEKVTCDVGVLYKDAGGGREIAVSAIATGKGANFRKWRVTDIRLRVNGEAVRPVESGKFFVREESIFRIPAAVVFAAIGVMYEPPAGASGLQRGIGKAGMAIGLGLLVWQAKGDIAGERCKFKLDDVPAPGEESGKDAIEITVENPDEHWKELIKLGLAKPPAGAGVKTDYTSMTNAELTGIVDGLQVKVNELEENIKSYKYGQDPEYDELQSKIESLQTRRGGAYKELFNRENK